MSETIYCDNTLLRAVARCDLATVLRHLHGLTAADESAPLRAGTVAHEVLADVFRGLPTYNALDRLLPYALWADEHIPPDPGHPHTRLRADNLRAILGRWIETHPLAGQPYEVFPELVEIGFAHPLAEGVIFTGRLDALVRDRATGAWYILDHKTTGQLSTTWSRGFRTDSQMTGYIWAAQQHLKEPVVGAFINGIEFARLPSDPSRKCRDHATPYAECGPLHARSDLMVVQRTPEQLRAWQETARALALRYKLLRAMYADRALIPSISQQGTFHGACTWCEFEPFCAAGRPVAQLDHLFEHRPWEPWVGAHP